MTCLNLTWFAKSDLGTLKSTEKYPEMFETQKVRRHDKFRKEWFLHLSRNIKRDVSFHISTSWWVSLLVDQGIPEGTCSQVLRSTSVDLWRLRASKFSVLKLIEIVILWVYYTIPFGLSLIWPFWGITFQLFELLCVAKDHWRGFSTRNVHMIHIVNNIRFRIVYTSKYKSLFIILHQNKCKSQMGKDQVSGGVSVLCWLAAPVANVLWKPPGIR